MKTLILSCNTGEGHNSCAKAIKEYYDQEGECCVIEDGLRFISPTVSEIMSRGHAFVYRNIPGLFTFGYRYTEKHTSVFQKRSAIYRFLTQGSEKIYRFITEGKFDTVICTHVFTALMLNAAMEAYPMKLATCFVATDYTCSPSTKESNLDYYFIPSADLQSDFIDVNITSAKTVSSGIPVRQMFYTPIDKQTAKAAIGIRKTHRHLLLMGGSMGCGSMEKILKKLAVQAAADTEITVVCGSNRALERKLLRKYKDCDSIHIKGFVQDMNTLMSSADLFLTKPGGISVSEAAAKALPMVLIDAVAGCEEYNRGYFIHKGCAKTGATAEELSDICIELLEHDELRHQMEANLHRTGSCNSAQIIYQQMKSLTEKSYA